MNVCGTQGTGQMILSKDMEESRVFLCELDQEGPGVLVCECVCVWAGGVPGFSSNV